MNEMIERMARVLAEREGSGPWDGGLLGERGREMWRATARAAIEAMREPTEAMYEAGSFYSSSPQRTWAAMVDEALVNTCGIDCSRQTRKYNSS